MTRVARPPVDEITPRDVFAMAALIGMCLPYSGQPADSKIRQAREAYAYADAMMEARRVDLSKETAFRG